MGGYKTKNVASPGFHMPSKTFLCVERRHSRANTMTTINQTNMPNHEVFTK